MRTSRNLNICKTQAGAPAANSVLQIETIRQKSSMSLACDDSTGSEIVLYVLGKPPRLTHAICTRTGSSYNASTASNTAPTQETLNTTSIFPALTPLFPPYKVFRSRFMCTILTWIHLHHTFPITCGVQQCRWHCLTPATGYTGDLLDLPPR